MNERAVFDQVLFVNFTRKLDPPYGRGELTMYVRSFDGELGNEQITAMVER